MNTCRGCGQEVDDETCYCGEPIPGYHDNHNPVPMGCECHLRRIDLKDDPCST